MASKERCIKPVKNDSEVNKILLEYFTRVRSGYVQVDEDEFLLPARYAKMHKLFDNFEIRNSDTIVASHPKTGTTWLLEMVWMISSNLDFEGAKEIQVGRTPFLEISCQFEKEAMIKHNIQAFDPPPFVTDPVTYINNLKDPRIIKTHFPWPLLPNQITSGKKEPKVIYVTRNPKDTCVSYYYHCRLAGYTGNFEQFTKLFLNGKVTYGQFWKHVQSYWNQRHLKNLLFLTYEEMKKDLPSVIRRVADFMGKSLTSEQVETLTKHLSFESMKQNPAVNYEEINAMNRRINLTQDEGCFMRSGTVGSYKADMTPDMIAKFDEWTKESLNGVDFPYPELII